MPWSETRNAKMRSIGIPDEIWNPLKERAQRDGEPLVVTIRRALREYLDKDESDSALFDAIKQAIEQYGGKP